MNECDEKGNKDRAKKEEIFLHGITVKEVDKFVNYEVDSHSICDYLIIN